PRIQNVPFLDKACLEKVRDDEGVIASTRGRMLSPRLPRPFLVVATAGYRIAVIRNPRFEATAPGRWRPVHPLRIQGWVTSTGPTKAARKRPAKRRLCCHQARPQ